MKGSDIVSYTVRFKDLVALCLGMLRSEEKKVERYIWGLVPPFQGIVLASNPLTSTVPSDWHNDSLTMGSILRLQQ